MPSFLSLVKTFGPRLLASVFAGAATYIGVKTSGAIQIDPAQAGEVVTGIFLSYAAAHRAGSVLVNPGDAAKGRIADAEQSAAATGSIVRVAPPK